MTRGIILDVDGTLVDSNRAHAYAWIDALREAGFRAEFPTVVRLIGMGGDKLLPRVTGGVSEDSIEGQRILARRAQIFRERYLPMLRPTAGAPELLRRLRGDGHVLAVASSARQDELDGLLRIAGADDLVPHVASSNDAEASKPDPDIVAAALRQSGIAHDEAVMIGDTPYDVEAARRAGVRIIAMRCGGWDDLALRGADAVYESPADLLIHYSGSIVAPNGHHVVAPSDHHIVAG